MSEYKDKITVKLEQDPVIEEEGITLKELFSIVWRGKWLLAVITFLALVVTVAAAMGYRSMESKVSTVVELQWNGVTNGQWPDGRRFDYTNMFESYVYANALLEADIDDITANELRRATKIIPIIPNDVIAVIEQELQQGNRITYYATEFKLSINNGELGITVEQAQDVMIHLIDGFREDFERKYIQRAVILDYTQADLIQYDYIDAHEILATQVQLIRNAVNSVLPGANNFVSTELGIRFVDISVRVNLVDSIELNTMSSRINNYLLSKDKDLLITRFQYTVERKELDLAKQLDIETELNNLIDNYVGSTVTIIIPGIDPGNNLDVDPYLNTLYANLVSTQANIAELTQDIIFYETRILRLEGNDPDFIVTPQKEADEIAKVELAIVNASNTLEDIVTDLDIMLEEYNLLVTRGLVRPLMAPQYDPSVNLLLFAAVGIVLGGGIGLVVVFAMDARKKAQLEKKQD